LNGEGEVAWEDVLEADRSRVIGLAAHTEGVAMLWADDGEADPHHLLSAYERDGAHAFTLALDVSEAFVTPRSLSVHCDGSLAVTGSVTVASNGGKQDVQDIWVARLAPDGSLRWSTTISAPPPHRQGVGTHIVELSTGDLGVAAQYTATVPNGSTTRTWLGRIGAADRY
jgi:hypothetical protein